MLQYRPHQQTQTGSCIKLTSWSDWTLNLNQGGLKRAGKNNFLVNNQGLSMCRHHKRQTNENLMVGLWWPAHTCVPAFYGCQGFQGLRLLSIKINWQGFQSILRIYCCYHRFCDFGNLLSCVFAHFGHSLSKSSSKPTFWTWDFRPSGLLVNIWTGQIQKRRLQGVLKPEILIKI